MRLSAKLGGGFILIVVLGALCGAAGLYGIHQLSSLLTHVTGPVWDTADGAMEGAIGIEAEMLGVDALISGRVEAEVARQQIRDGQALASEALDRMMRTGELPEKDAERTRQALRIFREAEEHLIGAHTRFTQLNDTLDSQFHALQQLMILAADIGNSAVEQLAQTPDLLTSWNTGLGQKWRAADGAKQAQVALLTSYYSYQRWRASPVDTSLRQSLETALETFSGMATALEEQSLFQSRDDGTGRFLSDALLEDAEALIQAFRDAAHAYDELLQAKRHYSHASATLLDVTSETRKTVDGTLEGLADHIRGTQSFAYSVVGAGLLLALVVAGLVLRFVVRNVIHSVRRMTQASQYIADGNLSFEMHAHEAQSTNDELVALHNNMVRMKDSLAGLLSEVSTTASALASQAEELSVIATQTRNNVQEQQQQTQAVASAVTELSASSREVAQATEAAKHAAQDANSESQGGLRTLERLLKSMDTLSEHVSLTAGVVTQLTEDSSQIGEVLEVISSIADQTNLLALNAAIEAARAGEQGRGFAVVADEVRTLAQKTQESTEEIRSVVEALQNRTGQAHTRMADSQAQTEQARAESEHVAQALQVIAEQADSIAEQNIQVAAAVNQQEQAIEEISRSINEIDGRTGETAEAVNQTSESSNELARLAARLNELVQHFRV